MDKTKWYQKHYAIRCIICDSIQVSDKCIYCEKKRHKIGGKSK